MLQREHECDDGALGGRVVQQRLVALVCVDGGSVDDAELQTLGSMRDTTCLDKKMLVRKTRSRSTSLIIAALPLVLIRRVVNTIKVS